MKKRWYFIIASGVSLILLIALIVLIAIFNWSWFILLFLSLFEAIGWLITGVICLVIFLRKTKPVEQVDLSELKNKIIHKMKQDQDNPDNLIVHWEVTKNIGAKGSEKTPVYIIEGHGSELNETRYAIVSLKKPNDISIMIDPSQNELIDQINKTADNPPQTEIHQEIPGGFDPSTGRFTPPSTKITRPSTEEIKKKEEEEKAEEGLAQ